MSIILTKRGNLASMPVLNYGELAYAKDKQRLYCGVVGGLEPVNLTPIQYVPLSFETNPPGGKIPRYVLNGNDSSVENYSSVDFRFTVNGGVLASLIPAYSFLTGYKTTIDSGRYSAVFGGNNTVNGESAFCCGSYNTCSQFGLVGGYANTNAAEGSAVVGMNNSSLSTNTVCFGKLNNISNMAKGAIVGGEGNFGNAWYSLVTGASNTLASYCGAAWGSFNREPTGGAQGALNLANNVLIIGNGTSNTQRSNCFRVRADGSVFGLAAFNSTGADYAEYFEWDDRNLENEDRTGLLVKITDGDKIAFANDGDEVLGVISASPSVVGNSHCDVWKDMYQRDKFGRVLYETVDGIKTPVINPEYNSEEEYISREIRPEWAIVGMFGRMIVLDDGSCQKNSYCKAGINGVATSSTTGYRVLGRTSENTIEILLK